MNFHANIKDILITGGATLWLLIALSVYSLALMSQRWRYLKRSTQGLPALLKLLHAKLASGNFSEAVTLCQTHKGIAAPILAAALTGSPHREERRRCIGRAVEQAVTTLQKGTTMLGTIATIAPFIGLFGTVVGVMRAFRDLAGAAGAGPGVVAIGISEALVCTAAGLFVAIPAVAAYNYFNHCASRFGEDMSWACEDILNGLSPKTPQ